MTVGGIGRGLRLYWPWLVLATALLGAAVGMLGLLNAAGITGVPWWQVPLTGLFAVLLGAAGGWLVRRFRRETPLGDVVVGAMRWPDSDSGARGWRHGYLHTASGRLVFTEVVGGFRAMQREPVHLDVRLDPDERGRGPREWSLTSPDLRVVELVADGERAELAASRTGITRLRAELG
ncbi:DUF2550 family protein [Desertihabitans aurantiacus]|uniref:DUF2550 family protein n=1 Tax=Desertihabitans aurantiacus TaxID=2282477 RepID=UPI000DF75109|nr:DUF2550 family protein [Desertihabitans aurantiacus]